MIALPDFSRYGYEVIQQLGHNQETGRTTYQANDVKRNELVAIKEFWLAKVGNEQFNFPRYQREIENLLQIEHPCLLRYLDCFETDRGFCVISEYKNAPSLAQKKNYSPEHIKQIAISVLETLTLLQKASPPLIHQDIKPEHILLEKTWRPGRPPKLNAYLIDFGLGQLGGGQLITSTPGFMSPEAMLHRPLTEASDLYSLGVTLLCLMAGIGSADIGNSLNDGYQLNFKQFIAQHQISHTYNPRFLFWLEKMVAINQKERYANASAAWEALKPLPVEGGNILDQISLVIKPAKTIKTLAISILSAVGLITGGFILFWVTNPANLLLSTKECQGCDLQNASLAGADLTDANLIDANLENANLEKANLKGAALGGANLKGANLQEANLEGAFLDGTALEKVTLKDRDQQQNYDSNNQADTTEIVTTKPANFYPSKPAGANLQDANLKNANLEGAFLEGVSLEDANLEGASLAGAFLKDANLKNANLKNTNLRGTTLQGAILPDSSQHE